MTSVAPEPEVELVQWFERPLDLSVATARTCYSSKVVYVEDVTKDERALRLRDEIARSTYEAGHHTTIQHPTFQFVLKKVSRQFVWSFLHSHPFYNSEQVSQRYVEVKPGHYAMPPLPDDESRAVYEAAVAGQTAAYQELVELALPEVRRRYFEIFRGRRAHAQDWEKELRKRALEVARYALPVATHAHLYHTIAGVTLHRYHRLCESYDTPVETRLVVKKMVEAVHAKDPLFFRNAEDTVPLEDTLEHRLFARLHGTGDVDPSGARRFCEEFDADLDGRRSKLIDWKANAERTVAEAVRSVLGAARAELPDEAAIEAVLDPASNRYLGSALNVTTLSKLSRALHHAHYTFKKKLSHTADSQDQRHRMTPGTRPILKAHVVPERPDYIAPQLVSEVPALAERFARAMDDTWASIRRLLERKATPESALYLLPNAFPIRFEESGDLLNLHHKWTSRLCYLAQEEIWRACLEEVEQVRRVHPLLGRHVLAPCGLRKEAGVTPFCPEGKRFCGVPVWGHDLPAYARTL